SWRVTPKATSDARPLPARVLLPHLVLALVLGAAAASAAVDGPVAGYAAMAFTLGFAYVGLVAAVTVLHLRENTSLPWRAVSRLVAATVATGVFLVTAVAVRWNDLAIGLEPAVGSHGPEPRTIMRAAGAALIVGG